MLSYSVRGSSESWLLSIEDNVSSGGDDDDDDGDHNLSWKTEYPNQIRQSELSSGADDECQGCCEPSRLPRCQDEVPQWKTNIGMFWPLVDLGVGDVYGCCG